MKSLQIWGEYLLVLSSETVKVNPAYEENILGGTIIGPRFERGVDGLQPELGQHSAAGIDKYAVDEPARSLSSGLQ